MQFPSTIGILRPAGVDEYGNPGTSFVGVTPRLVRALRLSETALFVPASTDIAVGDRITLDGRTWTHEATPILTPRGTKCIRVTLTPLEVQP